MTFPTGTPLRKALLPTLLSAVFPTVLLLADQTVQVGPANAFSPASVTVAPGEAVIWSFQAFHTSTSDAQTGPEFWDSGFLSTGTFSHTFTTPGSYPYYCQVHSSPGGTAMNGVVIVSGPGVTPTPTPTLTPTPTVPPTAPPATPIAPASTAIPTLDPIGTAFFILVLAAAGFASLHLATRR